MAPRKAAAPPAAGLCSNWTRLATSPYFTASAARLMVRGQEARHWPRTILHSFRSTPDGAGPMASLLLEHGILYGTTFGGGKTNGGTVFKVNVKTGRETVLYNFTAGADGDSPYAGVITDGNGNLYGTTGGGGIGAGVVYKLNIAARQETVLYSFTGGVDGLAPTSALVRDSQGYLYGTGHSGGGGTV